jgi:hypothetical protein
MGKRKKGMQFAHSLLFCVSNVDGYHPNVVAYEYFTRVKEKNDV